MIQVVKRVKREKVVSVVYEIRRDPNEFTIPVRAVPALGGMVLPDEPTYFNDEGSVCVIRRGMFEVYKDGKYQAQFLRIPAANKYIKQDWANQ